MTTEGHHSRAALDAYVQRVERLKDEKKISAVTYNDAIKEVFAEAKAEGYDAAAIKEVIRLRAMSQDKREMLHFYSDVLGVFG
jgi:uncharacterized protein (UPF0335 family)